MARDRGGPNGAEVDRHPFGGFELDQLNQLLERDGDRIADQIDTITATERLEEFGQGRRGKDIGGSP